MKNRNFLGHNERLLIILIIFLTTLVYFNSLKNLFVWDDYLVIVNNDFVKSWENLPAIFSKSYLTLFSDIKLLGMKEIGSGEMTYRPLVTASYFFDYFFWKLEPFGYHLTNLIIHILNVLLVYFISRALIDDKKTALLTCLLFSFHPANTEAVNVITFREDLLAFLFFMSSFLLFIRSGRNIGNRKALFYNLSVISFLFALFSKEMAVTLPIILILYDYYFIFGQDCSKIFKNFTRRYLAYIAILSFYVWINFFIMDNPSKRTLGYPGGNIFTNILTMSNVLAAYIWNLLFPANIHLISVDDASFISYSIFEPKAVISVLLISALFIFAMKIRKKSPLASFAMLWFFICLIPVLNLIPLRNIMAFRYLYLPAFGFCFLFSLAILNLPRLSVPLVSKGFLKKLAKNITVIILISYFVLTMVKNLSWFDNVVLWSEMVDIYPDSPNAHSNLGASFKQYGLLNKAINEYKIALRLDPAYVPDYNSLGLCYYKKGLFDEAMKEFKKALALDPGFLHAYLNLGLVFKKKGLHEESIECSQQLLRIDPNFIQAYNNLGVTYIEMKKCDEAKRAWLKALEINPGYETARKNLKKLQHYGCR